MKVSILLAHAVFGIRRFQNREIKKIAARTRGKKILEIGSGKKVDGKHYYSMKGVFDSSNEFVQSDINKEYGHQVIDITSTEGTNVAVCEYKGKLVDDIRDLVYEAVRETREQFGGIERII